MRKLVQLTVVVALAAGVFGASGCGPHTYASAGVAVGPPVPSEGDLYYDARSGYVWVEGRWVWDDYQYQWQPGYWIEARPGFVFIQGYWDLRAGHYYWVDGYWARHRPGFVYARGYWDWHDGRRVWRRGHWQRHRPGQDWKPGYWDRQGNKRVWRPGQWAPAQPRVRDHRKPSNRPRTPERVPSRRGKRR